jgi:signal transduction histidine kinase
VTLADRIRQAGLPELAAEVAELERGGAAAAELALAASRLADRDRHAAATSHELRQPILALKAIAEFLHTDVADAAEVRGHADMIREQAERLARLVEGLGGGAATSAPCGEVCDVAEVLRRVASLVAWRLRGRVSLAIEVPALPRARIAADRLEQVLLNLVLNGFDAVEETGVRGGVVVRGRAAGPNVELYVADDGAGVPAEVRARLFQPYATSKGSDRGGTGLGLVICRELLRAAGGHVELAEELIAELAPWPRAVKTLFRVTLPAA